MPTLVYHNYSKLEVAHDTPDPLQTNAEVIACDPAKAIKFFHAFQMARASLVVVGCSLPYYQAAVVVNIWKIGIDILTEQSVPLVIVSSWCSLAQIPYRTEVG